jgi:hypothetical protein
MPKPHRTFFLVTARLVESTSPEAEMSMEAEMVWPITRNKVFASSLCAVAEAAAKNQTELLYNFLLETTETRCTERYVSYTANVSYVKGIRSITYTEHDLEPQPFMGT